MSTPQAQQRYRHRAGIAETPFAYIKVVTGIRQFLLRGHEKVQTEWRWICCAYNMEKTRPVDPGVASRASFTKPGPYYASGYLMNVPRHCHQFIPEDPYGLPLIIPSWTPTAQQSWATRAFDTDGVHLLRDGKEISAKDAKPEILHTFEQAAGQLPFTATGVYWMARRIDADRYRVVLVDSGYLTPSDRDAVLTVHAPYRLQSAKDALNGKDILSNRQELRIHVPAGAFRIVDLHLRS